MEASCTAAYAGSWALSLATLATLEREHWPTCLVGTITTLVQDASHSEGTTLESVRAAAQDSAEARCSSVTGFSGVVVTFCEQEFLPQRWHNPPLHLVYGWALLLLPGGNMG